MLLLAPLPITVTYVNCYVTVLLGTLLLFSVPSSIVVDGRTYTCSYCAGTYSLHHHIQSPCGSLIDGGANGGDVIVLYETLHTAEVTGFADNTLQQIPVCTVAGIIQTQRGPIIGVFHQYAHQGTGKTIHSVSRLRCFGTIVDYTPRLFGAKQRLETLDGYPCPFVLVYLIWVCSQLLRRSWTLIPMFSSLQTHNGTLKLSMPNILLQTWTALMMIYRIPATMQAGFMFMVTLFHLPVNMTSTLERYNQTSLTWIPFHLISGLSLVYVSNIR
jgi:hypothetical protein